MKLANLTSVMERALSKMVIKAYQNREVNGSAVDEMTVMYNPNSIELSFQNEYAPDRFLDSNEITSQFINAAPGALNLELVFDAKVPGNTECINDQLDKLRQMCCAIDLKTRQTRFLRVEWGKMSWNGHGYFAGRASSLAVRYTLFDRDASPLRAVASLSLIADQSLMLQQVELGMHAPAKTAITMPDKGALPMIANTGIVGGTAYLTDYLSLAIENDLDHLNDFMPGEKLVVRSDRGKQ